MGISIRIEFHVHIHRDGQGAAVSSQSQLQMQTESIKEVETDEAEAKKIVANQEQSADFFQLAQQQIEALSQVRSLSTIENYRTALRSFGRYTGRKLPVSQLDAELLQGYERWLKEQQVGRNTSSCYMRSLRALSVRICGNDILSIYNKVYTGREETEKRAIQHDDLSKIRALKLKKGSFLSLVRDLFLFSFYTLGMPFVDMAFLRKSQISNNQITYRRHKTGQHICIDIEPCMQEIIHRYDSPDRPYVFPLLSSLHPKEAYSEYLKMLNRYNRSLKQLALKAGVSHKLTSYVSRHTWASIAYHSDVGLPVISKALGHANPNNTLIYIQQINDQRLYQANRKIIQKTLCI